MQLEEYKQKSAALTKNLDGTIKISRELKMNNSAERLTSIKSRFGDEVFRLVIVGEFSRGKSTFVNALLRRKILPALKKPTTAIISKIIYGDSPKFQLNYKGQNGSQILSEDEFKKLTAPSDPDESDKESVAEYIKAQEFLESVDHAEISYPLEFCKDGVEVVDTPGTNDLNKVRLNVTYGYLKRADAVILMLSASQPLTQSEINFLNDKILGNTINDIFFVISHKDDLTDTEGESVKQYVIQNLKKVLPSTVNLQNRVFLVSGLGALLYHLNLRGEKLTTKQQLILPANFEQTGFPALESSLGKFLTDDKGAARLKKYGREITDVISTMQHDLSINIGIINHSADEIREKVDRFDRAFNEAKGRAEIISTNMQSAFNTFIAGIDIRCSNISSRVIDSVIMVLDKSDLKGMSANDITTAIERGVNSEIKRFIDKISDEWQDTLAAENRKAQNALAQIWSDIDVIYKKEFTLNEVVGNTSLELYVEEEEDWSNKFATAASDLIGNVFKSGVSWFERVASGFGAVITGIGSLAAKAYNYVTGNNPKEKKIRSIREQITEYYEQQGKDMARNMKSQFESQTSELCANVQSVINARIDDMDRQLKNILAEKDSREQDVQKQREFLQQKQRELKALAEQCSTGSNLLPSQNNQPKNYIVKNEMIRREFDRALVETEVELDIISAWMNFFVVNDDMQRKFEQLLKRGVTIKILYGIGDMTPETSDSRNKKTLEVARQLQNRFSNYSNFKIKSDDTHQKLFICDEKFYVNSSFNILSYSGTGKHEESGEVSNNIDLIREYQRTLFNF